MKKKIIQESSNSSTRNYKLSEVLVKLMMQANIDNLDLSYHTGVPATTLSRLRNNVDSNPTISTLAPIANFFGVTLHQLLGEEELSEGESSIVHARSFKTIRVPILSIDQVAEVIVFNTDTAKCYQWVSSSAKVGEGGFAILARGSQSIPHLPSGAILIFSRSLKPNDMDYVVVQLKRDKKPVIRQCLVDGDDYYLKSIISPDSVKLSKKYVLYGVMIQALMNYRELVEI